MIPVRVAAALLVGAIAVLSGCTRKASFLYVTSTDKVYVFSADDPKNGAPIFPPFAVGDEEVSLSAPAFSNGTLYVASGEGDLYALKTPDLALKWKYHIDDFIGGLGTPSVENDIVYLTGWNGFLYAISDRPPLEPHQKWAFQLGTYVASKPTVVDGTVYVGGADGVVYAVSTRSDGTPFLKWSHQTNGGGPNPIQSSAVVVDDMLYIGAADRVYAFDVNGPKDNLQKWTFLTGGPIHSSPAVGDGTIYIGSSDGFVYAIDIMKQALKWKFQTGNAVDSSPCLVGGIVYVGSSDSNVYALFANTPNPNGALWWKYQTKSVVDSSPVAGSGMLFVGGEDHNLYALATKPKNPPTGDLVWKNPMDAPVLSPAIEYY